MGDIAITILPMFRLALIFSKIRTIFVAIKAWFFWERSLISRSTLIWYLNFKIPIILR